MGNTGDQENAAHDGGDAAQPPVIPGLHPETQELPTARYGSPSGRYRHSEGPYGPPVTRYSVKAFVIGWLVAYGMVLAVSLGFVFFWAGSAWEPTWPDHAPSGTAIFGSSMMLLVYIPLFEAFPALFIGVPAGLGIVFALRNVRNQWWHVLGFAVAGFLTPAPLVLLAVAGGGGDVLAALLLLGGVGALCAVVGRLAIWKLVEVTPPAGLAP